MPGIDGGNVETSNVDLASEFSNMILAERGFQANSRIIDATAKKLNLADLNPLKQIRNIFAIAHLRWLLITSMCYGLPMVMFSTELAVLALDITGKAARQHE